MGGKSTPAAPDYRGAAEEQSQASKEIAREQTWANRPNLFTPWGSQTWDAKPTQDPATGQWLTSWESKINLSPQQQQALDAQMAIQTGRSQAANEMLGRATDALGAPLDYSGISQGSDRIDPITEEQGNWRQQAQDAALSFQKPLQEQRQQQLESQLANMGLTRGSTAWNREMQSLQDQNARDNLQVFDSARREAELLGNQATQRQGARIQAGNFNQQLRQQEIAEMLAKRSQPLNELNALLTGQQVQNPQMPSFNQASAGQAPQYLQAAQMQGQNELDAYNAKSAGISGLLSGIGSIGSAGAGLFALSDERLKTDKTKLGTLANGVEVWTYRFIGSAVMEIGVLAQQVARIIPSAVIRGEDGWLRVNYAKALGMVK